MLRFEEKTSHIFQMQGGKEGEVSSVPEASSGRPTDAILRLEIRNADALVRRHEWNSQNVVEFLCWTGDKQMAYDCSRGRWYDRQS